MGRGKFKHIIVLIDGTWSSAAHGTFRDTTNIFRLNHAVDTEDSEGNPQITFYIPGPGTRGWTDKPLGGLFGAGIDQIIKEAYVNIASNYDEADETRESDKIYLFGFSRDAVAARALSRLISKCGLLYPRSIDRFWQVWDHFLSKETNPKFHDTIYEYINDDVQIELFGAFDSVLGRPHDTENSVSRVRFADFKLDPLVKRGAQILSIDESRRRFLPLMWDGIDCETSSPLPADADQRMEQIWLPGVHADIGGIASGRDNSPNFLANVSFLTMVERIRAHTSLSIDDEYVDEIKSSLRHINEISITNERRLLYMKMLARGHRTTGREMFGTEARVGEQLHPVYDFLHGEEIYIRSRRRRRRYENPNIDRHNADLARYSTELAEFYHEECKRAINAMATIR